MSYIETSLVSQASNFLPQKFRKPETKIALSDIPRCQNHAKIYTRCLHEHVSTSTEILIFHEQTSQKLECVRRICIDLQSLPGSKGGEEKTKSGKMRCPCCYYRSNYGLFSRRNFLVSQEFYRRYSRGNGYICRKRKETSN